MQLNEFKAWLEGYTLAGGKDIELIKAKLAEVVYEVVPFNPYIPVPIYPYVPFAPYSPTTGQPVLLPWTQISWYQGALGGTQSHYDALIPELQAWMGGGVQTMELVEATFA